MKQAFRLLLLGLVALITACAAPEPKPEPVVEVPKGPDPAALERARKQQIYQLLYEAEDAFAEDRLLFPPVDNAYRRYRQVLRLQPDHPEALWGIRQVGERYLQLAEQSLKAAEVDRAEQFLRRAAQVGVVEAKIDTLKDRYAAASEEHEHLLKIAQLSAKSPELIQLLSSLANRAREQNALLLIVARSDAEGRWIYQQMRQSVPGYRLRGNIEIGVRPKVVLLDSPA